jgi:HAD superfamily hydrolase (TIGR01509 family)
MKRKFLLWDHDGVLVDTEKWYFVATQRALAALSVELDQRTYLDLMADGRGYWDTARRLGHTDEAVAESRRLRDRIYQEYLTTQPIEIDGVSEVLSELGQAHRMAIVSTARRADFELIHRSRTIRQHFEFVITADDCTEHKPSPQPYQMALDRFGAKAEDALVIEDTSRGLRSAIAAGIDCVVIRNEFTASQDFTGAWRFISSIRELPAILAAE